MCKLECSYMLAIWKAKLQFKVDRISECIEHISECSILPIAMKLSFVAVPQPLTVAVGSTGVGSVRVILVW